MKRPVKTQDYDQGCKDGLEEGKRFGRIERDAERVWRNAHYWDWREWIIYVGVTLAVACAAFVIFWLVGCFIRWEVGPIPQPWAGITSGTMTTNPNYSSSCSMDNRGNITCH
jgi:hypothetical protein